MGKKARGRKGGIAAAENAHDQRRRASRAAAAAAVFSNTDRSTEPYPGFTAFSSRVMRSSGIWRPVVDPTLTLSSSRTKCSASAPARRTRGRGPAVHALPAVLGGVQRRRHHLRRLRAPRGGAARIAACWTATDSKATCHHVKLLGFQVKRDGMRGCRSSRRLATLDACSTFRGRVTRDDVGSAAANGDVAAIDRLLAQHGAAAAGATTAERPCRSIACAALQGHARAVTRLLRAGADPNAESHLGRTAAYGAAQNGHVAVSRSAGRLGRGL